MAPDQAAQSAEANSNALASVWEGAFNASGIQAQNMGISFEAGPPTFQNFAAPSTHAFAVNQQFQALPFFPTADFAGATMWQGANSGQVFTPQPALDYSGQYMFQAMPNAFVREMYDNLEPVDDGMDTQTGWQVIMDGPPGMDQGAMNAYIAARDQVTSTQPGLGMGW